MELSPNRRKKPKHFFDDIIFFNKVQILAESIQNISFFFKNAAKIS